MRTERGAFILTFSLVLLLSTLAGCSTNTSTTSTLPTGPGRLENITDGNQIRDLLISGNDLWAATEGGVVDWSIQKGTYRKYTFADGLASNSIQALTLDKNGNIWFAGAGVSRFDGHEFQNFTLTGVENSFVVSITCDSHGDIAVGALDSSISLYDGNTWRVISPPDIRPHLGNGGVTELAADDRGNIWAVIWGVLERFDGKSWHVLTASDGWNVAAEGNPITTMAIAPDGSMWFALDNDFMRYDGKSWTTIPRVPINNNFAYKMAFDKESNLWCANSNSISHYDGKSWLNYTDETLANPRSALDSIGVDSSGNVWCGNYGGILRFNGSSWQTYTTHDALPDNMIRYTFADSTGKLWFSTDFGLTMYDGQTWRNFTQADGLPQGTASAMFQDDKGNIWIGTLSGGIVRFDGKTWQVFPVISYNMGDNSIAAITQDLQGNLWFVTTNYAARYDGDSWVSFDLRIGVTKTNVLATGITVDKSGNVWVSTVNNGVLRYDGKNWHVYTTSDGLLSNNVSHVFQDNSGRLWFSATEKGVEMFDGQKWTTFVQEGLEYIRSIVEDRAGNLWFGTDGEGITKYDGSAWTSFTTAEGLPDNTVYRLLIAAKGNLWDASANGLSLLKNQTWQIVISYTQIALGSMNAAVAADDSLWFGGADGVAHYIP